MYICTKASKYINQILVSFYKAMLEYFCTLLLAMDILKLNKQKS